MKPWDDETDMKELEDNVRSIEMDGLVWGGGKLIPIGYGTISFFSDLGCNDLSSVSKFFCLCFICFIIR